MFKSTDLAYAAGYIDGDGCFHIGKRSIKNRKTPKFVPSLIISSTDKTILKWFKNTFGGTITEKIPKSEKFKIQYHFIFKRKDIHFINLISHYLIEKKTESIIFDQFHRSRSIDERENLLEIMNHHKFNENLIHYSIKNEIEPFKNTIEPMIEDFAYLAGFIDAECCLNIQKSFPKNRPNATYKIHLQCNNTKSPCFKWLLERFGGQVHFIDRSHMINCRNQMTWRLSANALSIILDKIHPFLKYKKPVCEELIKFYKTKVPMDEGRNSSKFREFYAPILEERERIFHKIQTLNKKGV